MKKKNYFLIILRFLIFLFIVVYILDLSGYQEAMIHKKVVLTSEEMLNFEEDIKNGEILDLNSYVQDDNKDYSNFFTKVSDKLNTIITKIMSCVITEGFDVIKKLF